MNNGVLRIVIPTHGRFSNRLTNNMDFSGLPSHTLALEIGVCEKEYDFRKGILASVRLIQGEGCLGVGHSTPVNLEL